VKSCSKKQTEAWAKNVTQQGGVVANRVGGNVFIWQLHFWAFVLLGGAVMARWDRTFLRACARRVGGSQAGSWVRGRHCGRCRRMNQPAAVE
jgi:hypothetical protein